MWGGEGWGVTVRGEGVGVQGVCMSRGVCIQGVSKEVCTDVGGGCCVSSGVCVHGMSLGWCVQQGVCVPHPHRGHTPIPGWGR